MIMNNLKFYKALEGTSVYPKLVPTTAINALGVFIGDSVRLTNEELAYCMATAVHEVGPALVPIRESLNYSADALIASFSRQRISVANARKYGRAAGEKKLSPDRQRAIANLIYGGEWGRKNLGNTQPNDGWDFRGGGFAQTTGRANFRRIGAMVGVDLEKEPGRIVDIAIATDGLIKAMRSGTYTGKRLSDYQLPAQFKEARAIINADVAKNGAKIARHANVFLQALRVAGRGQPNEAPIPSPMPVPAPEPAPEPAPVPAPEPAIEYPTPTPTPNTSRTAGVLALISVAASIVWAYVLNAPCNLLGLFCGN